MPRFTAVRCLRQYSRESKSKKYQPKNRFRFNSIFKKIDFDLRFDNRNITFLKAHKELLSIIFSVGHGVNFHIKSD